MSDDGLAAPLLSPDAGKEEALGSSAELQFAVEPPYAADPLRHSAPFILAQDVFESLCFYAMAPSLVLFWKQKLGFGNASAARATDTWNGTCCLTGIVGAVVADSFCGRFRAIVLFSCIYIAGTTLLVLGATSEQLGLVYAALYLTALGRGGLASNDQFDSATQAKEKGRYWSLFYLCINVGSLVATLGVVAVQSRGHWTLAYSITASSCAASLAVFLAGARRYRPEPARPWARSGPAGPPLREKAAALAEILPFVLTNSLFWATYTQMGSSFVLQGDAMQTRVGGTTIPAPSMNSIDVISVLVWVPVFELFVYPAVERRGVRATPLRRMAAGYLVSSCAMIAAAATEARRLRVARSPGGLLPNGAADLSILWQIPQYALVGLSEVLCAVNEQDFFYSMAPAPMRSLFIAMRLVSNALGGYIASLLVLVAKHLRTGGRAWFSDESLNQSRLDIYYALLAALMLLDMGALAAAGRRAERRRAAVAERAQAEAEAKAEAAALAGEDYMLLLGADGGGG